MARGLHTVPGAGRLTMRVGLFIPWPPGWLTRNVGSRLPRWIVYNRMNVWGRQREIPPLPKQTFQELYAQRDVAIGESSRNGVGEARRGNHVK
jgi:hypothetical protein